MNQVLEFSRTLEMQVKTAIQILKRKARSVIDIVQYTLQMNQLPFVTKEEWKVLICETNDLYEQNEQMYAKYLK